MYNNLIFNLTPNFIENVKNYINNLKQTPINLITLIIDIVLVIFLFSKLFKILKNSRAWQLLKGIILLVVVMAASSFMHLYILNYILTSFMTYGLIFVVLFQPELRRALEQLGSNRVTKFFGLEKDIETKTKEDIYKIAIASYELAKEKIGGLIVIERDIQIKDIVSTGIALDAEVSPQLLVNIFTPKTPLHDGAVVISNGRITAAACMLPLASDKDIARELGTRHRAAIGISQESDAIAVVISEETGKVSLAKDGTLIADVKEEVLKKLLIKHVVEKRFASKKQTNPERIKKLKDKIYKNLKKEQEK